MNKIFKVEQGTEEWLELRNKHIRTASRTAVVLDCSPLTSKETLAQEIKFGIKPFYNKAMKQGNELEDKVRYLANSHFQDFFMPQVGLNGELFASLDGINFEGDTIVELKVSDKTYTDIENGIIPEHYVLQVKHQMLVFNTAKVGYLFAYSPTLDKTICSKAITIQEGDFEMIKEGWEQFEIFMADYEMPTVATVEDSEALELVEELKEINEFKKELIEREARAKTKLKHFIGGNKTIIGDLTISTVKGRKTVSYANIVKELKVSKEILDKHTKVSEETFKYTIGK
ncbi:MAG: YqaJ viral recombinase family protein [Sulfurovum sp.]|nr:YqaJ viral recombinase family protein [Sulfurovaceae bacterium]